MASEGKYTCNPDTAAKGKKRKRYLPHNKQVKKKGSHPLRPGVQGFFITCDGGREHQASREALNIVDSCYEELVHGEDSSVKELSNKPSNTKIKFSDSDSSSSGDDDDGEEEEVQEGEEEKGEKNNKLDISNDDIASCENGTGEGSHPHKIDDRHAQAVEKADDPRTKKQCCKTDVPTCVSNDKGQQKCIDRLIEAELEVLGDKNKRRFVKLDSGCNGVVFVQMRNKDGDPGPKDIVQHLVRSAASTRKHMSRFILRILPIELACYASEEEISKAIKPLVDRYFPVETENPQKDQGSRKITGCAKEQGGLYYLEPPETLCSSTNKSPLSFLSKHSTNKDRFAVLYEGRANSGIDRMKIIHTVAKSVPGPHKVDLNSPEKTIVVEIIKTVCLVGVIEKYKELAKYNLRQLTSRKV